MTAWVGAVVTAGWGSEAWPQFRGPGGSGVAADGDLPVHFGPGSNLVWQVAVPAGHGSPCVWGDRIFLTGVANDQLLTLCLRRSDGVKLWQQAITPERLDRVSSMGSPATATPATDGRSVVVYFGSFGLAAYDIEGAERWRKPLPIPITDHGAGTSPVLAAGRVLLNCDQDVGSFLLAVDLETGKELWRSDRAAFRRGFATPLIWPRDRPEVVVVPGTLRLVAYDLRDGGERWSVRGLANEAVASAAGGDSLIIVAGWTMGTGVVKIPSYEALLERGDVDQDGRLSRSETEGLVQGHFSYIDADKDGFISRSERDAMAAIFDQSCNVALAVRPGGRGDVTGTHVVWRHTRGLPYVPTPLCLEGRVFLVKNGGLMTCLEMDTGRVVYQEERLGALGDYYASPVAAGGKICVVSQPGVAVVVRAGDTLDVLARNPLGEPVFATPAIIGRTLYIRSAAQVWAFADRSAGASPVEGRASGSPQVPAAMVRVGDCISMRSGLGRAAFPIYERTRENQ